ncbi:MAG TPA: glycoside hydrolase family 3 N-terminal domain-containing protein [Polyangia bacterium]|nr:glycoside hydrolase family 3 N-terminal domain-containing protein [Polyangia bacterium]
MFHLRLLSALSLCAFFAAGCPAPYRGGSSGTGGSRGMATGEGGTGATTDGGGTGGSASGSGGSGEQILTGNGGNGAQDGGSSTGTGGAPVKMACGSATGDPLPYTSGYTADPTNRANAMAMATTMNNDERAQQMAGLKLSSANYNVFNQEDNTNRGVRGWYFRDGPRGVNLNADGDGKSDFSTAFPVAIARGAAFDVDLEFKIGQAIGDEMLASGNTMMLAPTVNILRHPAWGRSQETYGEDVFQLGRLGSAFVVGLQQYMAACVKHYAANNVEDGRGTATAVIDEQTLREKYGRHYEMIVDEGGAASVMAAYNAIKVTSASGSVLESNKSTVNKILLTDMLRTEFGFQGFVLTDWWAMNGSGAPPCCNPGSAADSLTKLAVNAGLDMELPWRYNYLELPNLVTSGGLQASQLITSTARILEQKYRFHADKISGYGLKTPFTTLDGDSQIQKNDQVDPAIGMSHVQLAAVAAEEGMVLLKNDKSVLPLDRSTVKKIAVIGATVSFSIQSTNGQDCKDNNRPYGGGNCSISFATNVRTGDVGSSRVFSDPAKSVGPTAGIATAAGNGVTVKSYTSASAAMSDGFDVAIVVAGLTPGDEGEEYTGAGDRTTGGINSTSHTVALGLDPKVNPGTQDKLIQQVAAVGKPTIVVLEAGGIIDMSAWYGSVQAVVMAWYPGMVGGTALGRLLFGDANFSGKLPVTWDTKPADWPTFSNSDGSAVMDYWVGYQHFDHAGISLNPSQGSFPFGYGLSYTTFSYENLQVPCTTVKPDGVVPVQVEVHNQSPVAGSETVFLFVQYPDTTVTNRSGATYKELKGFYRVALEGKGKMGDAKRITIPLRVKDLKYWNTSMQGWAIEPKTIKVVVAPNAGAVATPCANGMNVGCSLSDTFTVTQ